MDGLLDELSPELAQIIGQPPEPPGSPATGPLLEALGAGHRLPTQTEVRAHAKEAKENARAHVSPALRRLGKVAELVPGAERVRIRKKLETGNVGYVGDYSIRDIETSGDLEVHLHRYVRPIHKGGDYYVSIFDSRGMEHQAGVIALVDPPAEAPQDSALHLVREMVTKLEQKTMNIPPQPDPIEQMMRAQRAMQQLKEISGQKDGASDPMLLMLAMQAFQQPRVDPALAAIVDRLDRRMEQLEKTASAPALPAPPPPPASPLAGLNIREIAESVVAVAALFKNSDQLSLKDVLGLLREKDPDRLTTRDVIELVREQRRDEKPSVTLQDQMQALLAMKQFASEFTPSAPPGPAGTTFWDALAGLLSQEAFGANLGRAIALAIGQKRGAQDIAASAERALPPAVDKQGGATTLAPRAAEPRIYLPEELRPKLGELERAESAEQRIAATIGALMTLYPTAQWRPFVSELLQLAADGRRDDALRALTNWFALLTKHRFVSGAAAREAVAAFGEHWQQVHEEVARMVGAARLGGSSSGSPAQHTATPSNETSRPEERREPPLDERASSASDEDVGELELDEHLDG
ncbi:hypothetical protein DB32_000539 [Sandaracinus amylolyticus]|uniref:Uncharacterized protein n=1 Tax=Sandaracinus amylolyticus TaxID=927083 RepID=A0A0F6VZF4_9BACT|nr:hypothetical protein DB32_000539 [Sandaracinus amylolyticus]